MLPNPGLAASSYGHDPKAIRISETMNRDIVFCYEDDDCAGALRKMEERKLSHLPVVNREMRIVGVGGAGGLEHPHQKGDPQIIPRREWWKYEGIDVLPPNRSPAGVECDVAVGDVIEGGIRLTVSNVHNPSITVFPAPKDKANGAAILIVPGGGHRQLDPQREGLTNNGVFGRIAYCPLLPLRISGIRGCKSHRVTERNLFHPGTGGDVVGYLPSGDSRLSTRGRDLSNWCHSPFSSSFASFQRPSKCASMASISRCTVPSWSPTRDSSTFALP